MESTKLKNFNGTGNVQELITKEELQSSLKGYTKKSTKVLKMRAQHIASRLEGPAFDVYLCQRTTKRMPQS